MTRPFISIIVPIFNTNLDRLSYCINSLLTQTLNNIEILLINDGSDNTVSQFLEDYSKSDSRLKYVYQLNSGVSAARNKGLALANGQYVMFVDADDWIDARCCEDVYNKAIKADLDIVFWTYMKHYPNHEEQYKLNIKNGAFSIYDMTFIGTTCKSLYKRKLLFDTFFDTALKYGEDVEFNFRLFKKVKKYDLINYPYYHYNIDENSTVRKNTTHMVDSYKLTLDKIYMNCKTIEEFSLYYSFLAISTLMILLNSLVDFNHHFFTNVKKIRLFMKQPPFNKIGRNTDKIHLRFTRKLPILFLKYKCYFLTYLVLYIRKKYN